MINIFRNFDTLFLNPVQKESAELYGLIRASAWDVRGRYSERGRTRVRNYHFHYESLATTELNAHGVHSSRAKKALIGMFIYHKGAFREIVAINRDSVKRSDYMQVKHDKYTYLYLHADKYQDCVLEIYERKSKRSLAFILARLTGKLISNS